MVKTIDVLLTNLTSSPISLFFLDRSLFCAFSKPGHMGFIWMKAFGIQRSDV
uniref:Uncharacterized protein n=1 Tax=Arundo donax TaxID=35708 RepID=A0A0A9HDZ4_ARUDO